MQERRRPDRLNSRELKTEVIENAAGGVIVRVTHLPSRRFTSDTGESREAAERKALPALHRIVSRWRYRREKGLTER
jgi:hypothetical protein